MDKKPWFLGCGGILVAGVLLAIVLGGWAMSVNNSLVASQEKMKGAWAQVETVLQRRYDLIPNLVETVKGYASHEKEIFENVATARVRQRMSAWARDRNTRLVAGFGIAKGDYRDNIAWLFDRDGDLDIVISNLGARPYLFRNDSAQQGNWLVLDLGRPGARVLLTAGGKTQLRYVTSVNSYLSSSDLRVHFGLADEKSASRIEIVWPDGSTQVLENVKSGQVVKVAPR